MWTNTPPRFPRVMRMSSDTSSQPTPLSGSGTRRGFQPKRRPRLSSRRALLMVLGSLLGGSRSASVPVAVPLRRAQVRILLLG